VNEEVVTNAGKVTVRGEMVEEWIGYGTIDREVER
jgi:hypothetical protein